MKIEFAPISYLIPLFGLFLVICSKKGRVEKEFVIICADTITVENLSKITPDTTLTPEKIFKLCLAISIAKDMPRPKDTVVFKEMVNDLAYQLSRESGRDWSREAAQQLYCASKVINEKLEYERDITSVKSYIKSHMKEIIIPQDSSACAISLDDIFRETAYADRKKLLAPIIYSLFYADRHLSNIITNFLFSEDIVLQDTIGIEKLVKGLVFDSAEARMKSELKVPKKNVQRDNSALALKYRNQQSIKNTISKHIPNLKAIYKKELKINQNMCGIIYVTFRVEPSGKVVSATIKSSEITNKSFLNHFLDYVRRIEFKGIPESVGHMTFDFPFEFKPEL